VVFAGLAGAEGEVRTLEELKELQGGVRAVVAKVMPATVSLFATTKNGQAGSGSGVVVSKDGLVLTAGHVVDGFEEVLAIFPSGKQVRARVLGANRGRDEAMVQLEGEGPWPTVELGDSDKMKVGDFVVSLGHAGGFDPLRTPPVRFGRILGRNPLGYLVSDCTLIGGDSGGPLFDLEGRLVAIHSSIGPQLASNNHRGVSDFVRDWDRMLKGEMWGQLTLNPLDNPDRPVIGFNVEGEGRGGLLVGQVQPNSPAAMAGIHVGDVVRALDGQQLRSFKGLLQMLNDYQPGDKVQVTFVRGNREMEREIQLARLGDVIEAE
ncbi:MAG: trypsin-like peptidase domain-containing protein, partial [Verrucomicrobia bacterium]|nr:trypsin-like peptidase domain-containing protein [Verrucomicrobiota bacterium]